ncbi:hypothetical protein [Frigoribacterium sp. UYMn621]|uniref:hypothetical protein n=1 Tax=Frigoribacterium sp. UYMn621 TaxID=3156343 RepID=UPI003396F573
MIDVTRVIYVNGKITEHLRKQILEESNFRKPSVTLILQEATPGIRHRVIAFGVRPLFACDYVFLPESDKPSVELWAAIDWALDG